MAGSYFCRGADSAAVEELPGDHRSIPVESDRKLIGTTFVALQSIDIPITDPLYVLQYGSWKMNVSSLRKPGQKQSAEELGKNNRR